MRVTQRGVIFFTSKLFLCVLAGSERFTDFESGIKLFSTMYFRISFNCAQTRRIIFFCLEIFVSDSITSVPLDEANANLFDFTY